MITFQESQTCITYIIKHKNDTYLLTGVKPPTTCRPSTNLPALDHTAHHSQQWVTPELGLNSTEQGIPRLGKVNRKVTQFKRKDSLPGATYAHLLTNSHSPHACPTPRVYTFTVTQSIDCSTSLTLGFNNRSTRILRAL
jgi:hypothetical protein